MNKDEGGAIPAPSTRSRSLDQWQGWVPSVDTLAKLVAVASAVLYGILFLAYRSYYVAVEINPEDVGVTNSFVLARVFGFILITLAVGVIVVIYLFITSVSTTGHHPWANSLRYVTMLLLGVALSLYLGWIFPLATKFSLPLFLVVLAAIAVVLKHMKQSSLARPYWPVAFAIVALLLSVAIPSIAVVERATQRGQQARAGCPVTPFDFLKIPIVDVSAPRIRLHWANPTIAPPREFFGHGQDLKPAEGVLLGQGDNIVIANVRAGEQYRVVRLNATAVIVELLDPRKTTINGDPAATACNTSML